MLRDEAGRPFKSADYGANVGTADLAAWIGHDRMWISRKVREGVIPGAFRTHPGNRLRFRTGPELDAFVDVCLNRASHLIDLRIEEGKLAERVSSVVNQLRAKLGNEGEAYLLRRDLQQGTGAMGLIHAMRDHLDALLADVRASDQPRWF